MKVKSIIAVTLSVCLVCSGAGYGIYYYMQSNKDPVNVIPVSYLSTQYYGDSSSISGTATSNVSQKVELDGSSNIKEVYVKEGDKVKVGDKLMAYDTTLAELDLEMEKLNQATLGLKMEAAQKTLDKLYNTTPVERENTAAVISNSNMIVMAEENPGVMTLNPQTESTVEETETEPVTEGEVIPLTPQTDSQLPVQNETETETQTESEISTDPETEQPISDQTEPATTVPETEHKKTESVLPPATQDNIVPVDLLDYESAADDGEGTKEKPFIFYCTEDVTIKGSFLNLVRGWDEEGTEKLAGGAYVIVAVRAKDAEDGKQRVLRLDGNSDKREQGYRPDLEWKFTPEGLEIIVDEEGNRIPEDQKPEIIDKKDFEKMFADKTDEEETESTQTEYQSDESETEIWTETWSETEIWSEETSGEKLTETATEEETWSEEISSEELTEAFTETEIWSEETETEGQGEEPQTGEAPETLPDPDESEQTEMESEEIQTEPESPAQPSKAEQKLRSMIISETIETETESESEWESESETQSETESETESEPWLATVPNAAPRIRVKLSYGSIDNERYVSGSGTFDDPYLFVCAENAQITGGFFNRVMGFDKNGQNRDLQKSCYVQLEIRQNQEGEHDYNGKTVVKIILDGTAEAESGFVGTDIWIFGKRGLTKQEKPADPDPDPTPSMEELVELVYLSLGDESYKDGTYYKGAGTKEDPFVFLCCDGTRVTGEFLNRVLGYDEAGENKISDGCYVAFAVQNPDVAGEAVEVYWVAGPEMEQTAYPLGSSWIFTKVDGEWQLIGELSELNYLSLGDENYKNGTYYKGTGTKEDPFVFICYDGTRVSGGFINRVLGYDQEGTNKISDGCYVKLIVRDPEQGGEFLEVYNIAGPEEEHEAYPAETYFVLTKEEDEWKLIAEDPGYFEDPGFDPGEDFWGDDGGITYTSEELKAAIREQEQLLKSLTLDEKEAELKIKQYEKKVKDGVVLSSINGIVKTAGDAETGQSDGDAFIVVTSDSGMYIVGNISELSLETLEIGDELTAQSLENGMTYTAVITEISKYPTESSNNYYGYGNENTNASYYPFKAYVEDADGLNDSASVTISISSKNSNINTIYLQMAYIRSENGQSYVYKAGNDGTLKKQYIKTGQIIYSSYMEVKEGLTMDDNIAFPYGSDVKEGAKTKIQDSGGYYYY